MLPCMGVELDGLGKKPAVFKPFNSIPAFVAAHKALSHRGNEKLKH
jgi:hypothetical protein